jgi:Protein of unknown function (DUF3800)
MKVFVDESGCFNWARTGKSTFCAVSLPDEALHDLYVDFVRWKQSSLGLKRRKEIKGAELETKQLSSFVENVVLPHGSFRLTYVAVDTELTSAQVVEAIKRQFADVIAIAAERYKADGRDSLAQFYLEMSFWIRKRSTQNFLWLVTLYAALFEAIQNTISRFADESFDHDFESWDLIIDRSFINRDRHTHFWKEWLRHQLNQHSKIHGGFKVPAAWVDRNHPVLRGMRPGTKLVDGSTLFGEHMYFADSERSEGVQLADICAHIFFRYLQNPKVSYSPLSRLHTRINDGGSAIRLIHMSEEHIWKDSPEAHIHAIKPEDYFREAALL